MLGLVITVAGILILTTKEYFAEHTSLARYRTVSQKLLIFGAVLSVLGTTYQYIENQRLEERIAHLYQRDVEELRELATYAFQLGEFSSIYFAELRDTMMGMEAPWSLTVQADLRSGIEKRHLVFGIEFRQASEDELRVAFATPPHDGDHFASVENAYGSFEYRHHVTIHLWARAPSASLADWFDLAWNIGYVSDLVETGVYRPDKNAAYDPGEVVVWTARDLGLPVRWFESWLQELPHLSGRDLEIRTQRLMSSIRRYKESVWDRNPW